MKRYVCFCILFGVISLGCDRFKDDAPAKNDTLDPTATDTDTGSPDTESTSDKSTVEDASSLSPIKTEGRELEEIALALEAKRMELEQQQRDLLQREQMINRLETEALSKKDELDKLQKETKVALDDAVATIKNQYTTEHEKLLKHWDKIKEEHKVFISKYLETEGKGKNKGSLKPEIERLQKERKQRIDQLLKTIEGMNPASSAMMLTSMELEDAVEVMSGLSSTKSAEILGSMTPQKAAELAKGLLGPKVPTVSELEDVELPKAPEEETENDTEETGAKKK